ncbi:hypothetical protein SESBI_28455 [Sesbania bispinosa]|nr:hypothetical protein SESBI_28455 [Sesbania bispinosa]
MDVVSVMRTTSLFFLLYITLSMAALVFYVHGIFAAINAKSATITYTTSPVRDKWKRSFITVWFLGWKNSVILFFAGTSAGSPSQPIGFQVGRNKSTIFH